MIGMTESDFVRESVKCVREWRDNLLEQLQELGCSDLSFRSEEGIPSFGWIIGHQAAVYDYSLNVLIKGGSPKNPRIFSLHTPGTSGDWSGIPMAELLEYFDSGEKDFLEWFDSVDSSELERKIEAGKVPQFFAGRTVRNLITTMFTHLNYHTGHLAAMRTEWRTHHSK